MIKYLHTISLLLGILSLCLYPCTSSAQNNNEVEKLKKDLIKTLKQAEDDALHDKEWEKNDSQFKNREKTSAQHLWRAEELMLSNSYKALYNRINNGEWFTEKEIKKMNDDQRRQLGKAITEIKNRKIIPIINNLNKTVSATIGFDIKNYFTSDNVLNNYDPNIILNDLRTLLCKSPYDSPEQFASSANAINDSVIIKVNAARDSINRSIYLSQLDEQKATLERICPACTVIK